MIDPHEMLYWNNQWNTVWILPSSKRNQKFRAERVLRTAVADDRNS